ncbi:MAG: MtrB/PioB family outer membrane beta-barrel protein [Candidatus Methylomirabilia bacterium]
MKTRIAFSLLAVFLLLGVNAARAAGESEFGGTVTLRLQGVSHERESAKSQEYRDLQDGVAASADLRFARGAYYLEIDGRDFGLDDQSLQVRGGAYGSFKYTIFYNETPHNYSFGARTFFTGIGTDELDYPAAPRQKNNDTTLTPAISRDENLWNRFDYSIQRKEYGSAVEVSLKSPFFFTIGAKREQRTGTKPLGADSGVFADITGTQNSSFGNVTEMPEPVDYLTSTAIVQTGYRTRPAVLTLTGIVSSFDNDNETLNWRNPYVTTERVMETNYLPPDNDYWKVGAQGVFRLPAHSTLALRVSYAHLKDDLNLGTTTVDSIAPNATNGIPTSRSPLYFTTTLGLNRSRFKGDIGYTNVRVAYDTSLLKPLTLELLYDYTGKNNESSIVEYTNLATGETIESELFEYHKHHAGLGLGIKLPGKTALSVGYDFTTVDRTVREDGENTDEHDISVRLRNSASDLLTTRVKYQHIFRSSESGLDPSDFAPKDDAAIDLYERRYDIADKDRDVAGISFALTPTEQLDLGLEYTYIRDDYDESNLGLQRETRHEVYLDLSYRLPRAVTLGASAGYEYVDSDQRQRQFNPGNNTDPASPDTVTAFNWSESLRSNNWSCGLAAKIPVLKDKIDLTASWNYQQSDGKGLFSSTGKALADISDSDDYTKHTVAVKATFHVTQQLEVILGYLHEELDYSDDQWNQYKYATNTSFLTGAFSDVDYNIDVGYLKMRFSF